MLTLFYDLGSDEDIGLRLAINFENSQHHVLHSKMIKSIRKVFRADAVGTYRQSASLYLLSMYNGNYHLIDKYMQIICVARRVFA